MLTNSRPSDDAPTAVHLPEATAERIAGGRGMEPRLPSPPPCGDDHGEHVPLQPLFRREAYDAMAHRGFGAPVAHMPFSWRLLTVLAFIMVARPPRRSRRKRRH